MLIAIKEKKSPNKTHMIIKAYKMLKQSLRRYNRSISFPKNTDPSKTYNWRFLSKFIDEFEKIGLPEYVLSSVIDTVVIEASNRGILDYGVSILTKIDVLKAYNKKLERELTDEVQMINNIIRTHEFLVHQHKQNNNECMTKLLANRIHNRAYANITRWNQSGELNIGYIAVSKSCKKALKMLDKDELTLYPSPMEFIKIRITITCNKTSLQRLKALLGDDLIEE